MPWEVEFTDQFGSWWDRLDADAQEDIRASVLLLQAVGPTLGRPHVDTVDCSRYPNMKELRTQSNGRPFRTFFAFGPRRTAILLIGGDKSGNNRFYQVMIPTADLLYEAHLKELKEEETHGP